MIRLRSSEKYSNISKQIVSSGHSKNNWVSLCKISGFCWQIIKTQQKNHWVANDFLLRLIDFLETKCTNFSREFQWFFEWQQPLILFNIARRWGTVLRPGSWSWHNWVRFVKVRLGQLSCHRMNWSYLTLCKILSKFLVDIFMISRSGMGVKNWGTWRMLKVLDWRHGGQGHPWYLGW